MSFETSPQMILTAGSDRGAADADAVHGEAEDTAAGPRKRPLLEAAEATKRVTTR